LIEHAEHPDICEVLRTRRNAISIGAAIFPLIFFHLNDKIWLFVLIYDMKTTHMMLIHTKDR
jgi:hypothetical protein